MLPLILFVLSGLWPLPPSVRTGEIHDCRWRRSRSLPASL